MTVAGARLNAIAGRGTIAQWAGPLVLLLLASCAAPSKFFHAAQGEYVWPAPPEQARVRYLGEISGPLAGREKTSGFQRILFGPQPRARLVTPHAVAVDPAGRWIAVADPNGHCVHLFDWETRDYRRIEQAEGVALEAPVGVAWGRGFLFVSDPPRKVIDAFAVTAGADIRHERSIRGDGLGRPTGLAFDQGRNILYVCDPGQHRIAAFDGEGHPLRIIGGPGAAEGEFRYPAHLGCGEDGTLAVSDAMNFRVQRLTPEGKVLSVFGRKGDAAGDLALPKGIAADAEENVWVVDAHFENVQAFSPRGELLLSLGGEGHGPGQFWLPAGAFIDRQNRLWVADTYNRRVQVFQLMP